MPKLRNINFNIRIRSTMDAEIYQNSTILLLMSY